MKSLLFGMLGKDPEPVIAILGPGPHGPIMRGLVPHRRHIHFQSHAGDSTGLTWLRLRHAFAPYRVALAAVSRTDPDLLRAALLAFPNKVLLFDQSLDRHHLRLSDPISSALFLRGLPKDRIHLRPTWLCPWKKDRSVLPQSWRALDGRPWRPGFPRVAVLSPYCPWPPSHGGAVRIYNLLKEASRDFDLALFAFEDGQSDDDFARVTDFCSRLYIAAKPRYREPRWSTLLPPEACEFYTPALRTQLHDELRRLGITLLQTEYTQLARYGGDVLTEHDVTFDLFQQIHRRAPSLASLWNLFRWRRFETRALSRYRRIVAMSEKDAGLIGGPHVEVIPNGVDLARFTPAPEPPGSHILFIGTFRHFPNLAAWRFFSELVWPLLQGRVPGLRATIVAGPDPHLYWPHPSPDPAIELHGYVADVKPLYDAANLVIIPTVVSAGTNLKALEAMAMDRAIVSTPSGVAGLGLVDNESVAIAESPQDFAAAILNLLADEPRRRRLASSARRLAVERYGWPALAERQTALWRTLLAP